MAVNGLMELDADLLFLIALTESPANPILLTTVILFLGKSNKPLGHVTLFKSTSVSSAFDRQLHAEITQASPNGEPLSTDFRV